MKRALALSLIGLGLTLAACGESSEDKAKDNVCDARDEVQKNVNELKDLTIGSATVDQVNSNLKGIKDGLTKMVDAQGDLSDKERRQVEQANQEFQSQLQSLAKDLGSSTSLEDAAAQLKSGFAKLASTYEDALAPIDCG
jgi:protein involved in sex pheromone biosynthesis